MVAALAVSSCRDDMLDCPGEMPEGETLVRVEMDFSPFAGAEVRSFQDNISGNRLSGIDDIVILIYDADGNILEGDRGMRYFTRDELTVTNVPRQDEDASNGHKAESETERASVTLNLDYGRYYMYALANIGRWKNGQRASSLDELRGNHGEAIKTVKGLLGIQVDWDNSTLRNNSQMLGVFTDGRGSAPHTPGNSDLDSNPNFRTIVINRPGMTCHAWLRRCASKVTIDFDGSGLLENTRVYFKQATVHDIASSCFLGSRNQVMSASGLISNRKGDYGNGTAHPDYRPLDGTRILYYPDGAEGNHESWPWISKGKNQLSKIRDDSGNEFSDYHAEGAPALYLFENMQGNGVEGVNDKEMNPEENGTGVDGSSEIKDKMEFGSYIEVEGFYDYHTSQHVSKGKIYYRFMLGNDTKINFDTERNYHYKLTLKVRGMGNDYDWHIEYDEQEGFDIRDPYFVSYLYNHSSTIPFKYTPESRDWEVYKLDAEIVGNNWWPDDYPGYASSVVSAQNPRSGGLHKGLQDDFTRNLNTGHHTTQSRFLGNGFLSLRKPTKMNLTFQDMGLSSSSGWNSNPANQSLNDNYFYGRINNEDRSRRTYKFDGSDGSNKGDEAYTMSRDEATGGYEFNIPMFTRAKNLVKTTGYTGNNPFVGHTRSAFVRLTVYMRNRRTKAEEKRSQIVRVEQVKRVVNPKGIYRRAGNNEPFHVRLMTLENDGASKFNVINSRGPWMAEVIGPDDFIKLNGRHKVIRGATDTDIDFNINFNQMNREDDKTVRSAIIRVRYNNYTCVHLIFVRQGYAPQMLAGTKWRISNLRHNSLAATDFDPRDEGSLFKRGNISDAIHPVNNTYGTAGFPASFPTAVQSLRLSNADGTPAASATGWRSFDGSDTDFSRADMVTMEDFDRLYSTPHMQFGFGVLYADGATETADNIQDAYGYYYGDVDGGDRLGAARGMRGVFAYYWNPGNQGDSFGNDKDNCKSIFFPIGRSGYGHRRTNDVDSRTGILRYSCGRTAYFSGTLDYQPLFYDLFRRPGAIYWARNKVSGGTIHDAATGAPIASNDNGVGLDMNFFTYDVNYISLTNIFKSSNSNAKSDACFIRLKE